MSANDVIAVATFVPRPGQEKSLETALRTAVQKVHEEPGCLRYALHSISRGGTGMVIIEHWESADALATHGRAEAFAKLASRFDELLAKPLEVVLLAPLPEGDGALGKL